MERKEHPVPVIEKGGDVLEFLDSDGNPFKPSGSVKYQLIAEDGSVISEGTLDQDTNTISLAGITAKSFKVLVDSHFVTEIKGVESPEEESDEGPVEKFEVIARPTPSGELEEGFESLDEGYEESVDEETGDDDDSDTSDASSDSEDQDSNSDQSSSDDSAEDKASSDEDNGSEEDDTEKSANGNDEPESSSDDSDEDESNDSDSNKQEESSDDDGDSSDKDDD